jgi:hypothetical protein
MIVSRIISPPFFLGSDGVFKMEFNLLWCYGMVAARKSVLFCLINHQGSLLYWRNSLYCYPPDGTVLLGLWIQRCGCHL